MSLDQVATLADIVAGLGLVISLIFVGWQIRQNSHFTRMEVFADLSKRIDDIRNQVMEDPGLASILLRAENDPSALSAEERLKFNTHMAGLYNTLDVVANMAHSGLRTEFGYQKTAQYMASLMKSPTRKAWYERHAHQYSPALRDVMAYALTL